MFGRNGRPDLPRDVLHRKADEIDDKIHQLTRPRHLRHVAECKAPSHMECPTFRRLVELSGKQGVCGSKGKGRQLRRHLTAPGGQALSSFRTSPFPKSLHSCKPLLDVKDRKRHDDLIGIGILDEALELGLHGVLRTTTANCRVCSTIVRSIGVHCSSISADRAGYFPGRPRRRLTNCCWAR